MVSDAPTVLRGRVRIPASKPHTQRALLMAALADGESVIRRPNACSEVELLAEACRAFGAGLRHDGDDLVVRGVGGRPRRPTAVLRVAGSGYALRHLLAVASLADAPCVLTGDRRLAGRPVQPLLDALGALGGRAESADADLVLPIVTWSTGLAGGAADVPADETSQFVSALMLAAPYAAAPVRLRVTGLAVGRDYIRMTRDMMTRFGAAAAVDDAVHQIDVQPGGYQARDLVVGPDATSLFYFIAAAVIADTDILVEDVVLGQDAFLDATVELGRRLGVVVSQEGTAVHIASGPAPAHPLEVDATDVPTLVSALAALASSLPRGMMLHGARHVGFHKTPRLRVVMDGLAEMGRVLAPVWREGELDGFRTVDTRPPAATRIGSQGDHRNYMALYLAALAVRQPVQVLGADTLHASFADFRECFRELSALSTPA